MRGAEALSTVAQAGRCELTHDSMKQIAAGVLSIVLATQACRRGAVADPAADRDAVNAALEQYRQAWLKGDTAMALRDKDQVFNMDWKAPEDQRERGTRYQAERKIRTVEELTSCSTCHR